MRNFALLPALLVESTLLSESPLDRLLAQDRRRRRRRLIRQQSLERIALLEQVDPPAVLGAQAPFRRLKQAPARGAAAGEAHERRALGALDGEVDVDAALHLVHLAADPGDLVLEVDFVAEDLAGAGRGAQRVEGRGDDGRRRLLVVEDGKGRGGDEDDEEGEGAAPAESDLGDVYIGSVSKGMFSDWQKLGAYLAIRDRLGGT